MLVPNMTEEEILREIKADLPNVLHISDTKDSKVRRIIQKSVLFPVRVHSFVTTARENKWIILWEARTKKSIGDKSLITFICYQETPRGRYAFMTTYVNDDLLLIVYPPHFFSRFAERMNLNLTGLDLMRRFFEYNSSYVFQIKPEKLDERKYILNVYGSCSEGVAMGVRAVNPGIYLFKTFITYEMCRGEQIEEFAKNEKIRQEIHENIIWL